MSKISNVITMLQLLNTGRKYSIKELSERLEVSERMIRVYKDELEKAGIYVDTIMGPYGGYVLRQSVKMPIRKFKVNDYEILDKYISLENDNLEKEKLMLLRDKIYGMYISNKNDDNIITKDDNQNKYNILTRAIKEKRKVKINYFSYNKGENERVICPAEMFLFSEGWYVAAFCLKKNDIRHFELKRIIDIELLAEKF